jgi:hypothetical protein
MYQELWPFAEADHPLYFDGPPSSLLISNVADFRRAAWVTAWCAGVAQPLASMMVSPYSVPVYVRVNNLLNPHDVFCKFGKLQHNH